MIAHHLLLLGNYGHLCPGSGLLGAASVCLTHIVRVGQHAIPRAVRHIANAEWVLSASSWSREPRRLIDKALLISPLLVSLGRRLVYVLHPVAKVARWEDCRWRPWMVDAVVAVGRDVEGLGLFNSRCLLGW